MKTITPESARELIDSLVDTRPVCCENHERKTLIGNILEKMKDKSMISIDDYIEKQERLLCLWSKCGYSRSIQEIVAGGMIESCVRCGLHKGEEGGCSQSESGTHYKWVKVLKPEVENLLLFLKELNLK